jgi:hypothetical protein
LLEQLSYALNFARLGGKNKLAVDIDFVSALLGVGGQAQHQTQHDEGVACDGINCFHVSSPLVIYEIQNVNVVLQIPIGIERLLG